jgi:hypothetical protein
MGPRAKVGYLVGYEGDHGHIYHVYISGPGKGKVVRPRDVTFKKGDDDSDDMTTPVSIPPPAPPHPGFGQSLGVDTADTGDRKQSSLMIEGPQYTTGRAQTLSTTPERDHSLTTESLDMPRMVEFQQQTITDFITQPVRQLQAVSPSRTSPDPSQRLGLIASVERLTPSVASQASRTSSRKAPKPK